MPSALRIEGYAIVSRDGMIADRDGRVPSSLKIEADQRFFEHGLDHADLIVHGRNSYEDQPGSPLRRRLILTRKVAAIAEDPSNPKALLWNPARTPFAAACRAIAIETGIVAIIGGTEVFGLFLESGYDAFHLSKANKAQLPLGLPVFPGVPAQTPESLLSDHGLQPTRQVVLDAQADLTLATWERMK